MILLVLEVAVGALTTNLVENFELPDGKVCSLSYSQIQIDGSLALTQPTAKYRENDYQVSSGEG